MIIDTFDKESPAKINVAKNENAVRVDAVIYTFSHEIEEHVLEKYDCEKIGEYKMATGSHSAYVFNYHGKKFGFFKTWVGAPACIAPIEELTTVMEADKFIHFGGAGCLDKDIARGRVMIPTEAYRDEGTSYHYAPASDYIRIKNWKIVRNFMEDNKIPYVLGKTWTTDAYYRETVNDFQKRKADGCISVEMEGSAVQAVCDFRGYEVYMFFTGGDLLDAPEWTMRKEKGQKVHTQHDTGHFDIALALAEYVVNL